MAYVFTTRSAEESIGLGKRIGESINNGIVIILDGLLGSGKTTLVKGIAEGLGVKDIVTSPSFTIMSEYVGRLPFIHIDLYRTGSDEELELLGFEQKLSGNSVIAIEWGEKAEHFLPDRFIHIALKITDDGSHTISIEGIGFEFTLN